MATLSEPVLLIKSALLPMAVLLMPVVLLLALIPMAVLSEPVPGGVLFWRAPTPTAVFSLPSVALERLRTDGCVVGTVSDAKECLKTTAVLSLPVVRLKSAESPSAVVLFG